MPQRATAHARASVSRVCGSDLVWHLRAGYAGTGTVARYRLSVAGRSNGVSSSPPSMWNA